MPQQLAHQRGARVHQMLEPVHDQQELTLGEMVEEQRAGRPRRLVRQREGLHERVRDEIRIAHGGQFHPP